MATGESKTLEIFYHQESLEDRMASAVLDYYHKHGEFPSLGGLHGKYKQALKHHEPMGCGGHQIHGVHWHFVHMDYGDKHNITEMFVCNHDYTKFEGI